MPESNEDRFAARMEAARQDLLSGAYERELSGVSIVERLHQAGYGPATYAVATWYLHGAHGYHADMAKAAELLEVAATKLVPAAAYDLAVTLEQFGPPNSKRRAFGFYVLGGLLGDKDCLRQLRRTFYWGIGTFKNREIADLIGDLSERDAE